jgi:CheY-like chemotaxis protein
MSADGAPVEPVLVVEDDADLRETMVMLLEGEGYRVATAANGKEALGYLQRCPPPCLILLDLMMPVMNGWEFRERQQQDLRLTAIPVLIVSAVCDTGSVGPALGAAECLVKPIDVDVLLDRIHRYCHRSEKRLPSSPQH